MPKDTNHTENNVQEAQEEFLTAANTEWNDMGELNRSVEPEKEEPIIFTPNQMIPATVILTDEEQQKLESKKNTMPAEAYGKMVDDYRLDQFLVQSFKSGFYAITKDGRYLDTEEGIKRALHLYPSPMLYIYEPDAEYPYAVKREKNGTFLISETEVSPLSPLTEEFLPRRSFKEKDIAAVPSFQAALKASDRYSDNEKLLKNQAGYLADPEKKFAAALKKLNEERAREGKEALEAPGEAPKAPKGMSFGQGVWWLFVKVVTLAIGTTKAAKEAKQRKQAYKAQLAEYRRKKEAYKEGTRALAKERDEALVMVNQKIDEASENAQELENKKKEKYEAYKEGCKKAFKEISSYRNNMEVRLEALNDIRKNGLTPDNLFANTWLAEGKLKSRIYHFEYSEMNGADQKMSALKKEIEKLEKKVSELTRTGNAEQAQEAQNLLVKKMEEKKLLDKNMIDSYEMEEDLAVFLLSYTMEHKLRADRVSKGTSLNDAATKRLVKTLESPNAVSKMRESEAFRGTLSRISGRPLNNTNDLLKIYTEECKHPKFAKTPIEMLTDYRKSLVAEFGKHRMTKDDLSALLKLKLLDREIAQAKEELKPEVKTVPKMTKDAAKKLISDLSQNLGASNVRFQVLKEEQLENLKNGAFGKTFQAMKLTEERLAEAFKAIRKGAGDRGKEYTLEELEKAVETNMEKYKEANADREADKEIHEPKIEMQVRGL